MQNQQEKTTISARAGIFNTHLKGTKHSLQHLKATLATFVILDEKHHLEGVVHRLRDLNDHLAQIYRNLDEYGQNKVDDWRGLLRDLEEEFTWQVHHGIRIFEPL